MTADFEEDEWGDFATSEAPTPSAAQFTKGQAVEYKMSGGQWVPTKIISIDLTVSPPSYCIELETGARETEEWRLRLPRPPSEQLPPQQEDFLAFSSLSNISLLPTTPKKNFNEEISDDVFGDFTASPEITVAAKEIVEVIEVLKVSKGEGILSTNGQHTPSLKKPSPPLSPARRSPRSNSPAVLDSFHNFLRASAPEVAHRIEEEDSREEMSNGGGAMPHQQLNINGNSSNGQRVVQLESIKDYDNNNETSWGDDFGDFEAAASTTLERAAEPIPAPPSPPLPPPPPPPPVVDLLGRFGTPPATKAGKGVQEYGVAWSLLLDKAAAVLETGRALWSSIFVEDIGKEEEGNSKEKEAINHHHNHRQHRLLLEDERVQKYLAGLGRVYFVASLVRLAADQLGLMHVMPELHRGWAQCESSWRFINKVDNGSNRDGGEDKFLSLQEAALIAADKLGVPLAQELAAIEAAVISLPSMSMDDFPRMLMWCQGLDSLTLLPLSVFNSVSVVHWGEEQRPCMAPLANFWMHCVSIEEPELD